MIRVAISADAGAIAAVQLRAWQRAYADFLPPEAVEPATFAARRARWLEHLENGSTSRNTTQAFDQDGVVAGFASIGPARDRDAGAEVGELMALYVDPVAQGAGVGRALLDAAEGLLRADSYATAVLWVFAENGMARDFYARHGWALEPADVIAANHGADWWAPAVRYRLVL